MQTNKTFSISEALNFGWETFKKQPLFWILVTLIQFVIGGIGGSFDNQDGSGAEAANIDPTVALLLIILSLVFMVISLGIQLGSIRLELDAIENKELKYSTLFSQFDAVKLFKFIVATIIFGLFVFVGILLLIVPGLYWALKYQYYGYFMVDKGVGIFESFKMSAELTKSVKIKIAGYVLVSFVLMIAGVLAFLVGLLVVTPVISLGYIYIFKKLQAQVAEIQKPNIASEVQPQVESLAS